MNLALCICTRNRPNELYRCLDSIAESTLSPHQILISDDSDESATLPTQNVCSRYIAVAYVRGPCKGLSANRNRCIEMLGTEIDAVSFIDDDVVLRPAFLQTARDALRSCPEKSIVTGAEIKNGFEVRPNNCSFWGHQEVLPKCEADYHAIVINSTLFPRSVFSIARFDPFLRYGSEEIDFCAQAEAFGYQIRFFPQMLNDHFPSPINRGEYNIDAEASRLYATFKRYRWIERDYFKAMRFALLAPLHSTGHAIRRNKLFALRNNFTALGLALRYARERHLMEDA